MKKSIFCLAGFALTASLSRVFRSNVYASIPLAVVSAALATAFLVFVLRERKKTDEKE